MTYIQVDKIFHEIDTLSKIISVPRSYIEEIIDKGIESGSDLYMSRSTKKTLDKMRFASYLISMNITQDLSSQLLTAYNEGNLDYAVVKMRNEKLIDQRLSQSIQKWGVSM